MGLTKMVWFRVVNDLVHDIAAGMWPGMVVALWIVRRGALPVLDAEAVTTLASTWTWVLLAALVAATGQVVSGTVRLGYHYDGVPDEARSSRPVPRCGSTRPSRSCSWRACGGRSRCSRRRVRGHV